ncbi:MAG: ABC transporter permease [bacterium]|nr:ABC transporter permease [bacterium]
MFGNIFKFGWRNFRRNKRRTFFTLLAIAVGVMSVIFAKSYIQGIMNNVVETAIKTQAGHVRIAHKEFLRLERIMPREYLVTGMDELQRTVSGLPEFEILDQRIKFNVLLSHGDVNENGLAMGIDPAAVDKTMALSETIVKGKYFGDSEKGLDLIIGKKLAEKLHVTVNDELLLVTTDINYSTYALPFNIVGIFETGFSNMDKHILYIPLQKAREMLDCGDAAHEILVFLNDPAKSWEVCGKIKQALSRNDPDHGIQVIPWQENDLVKSMPVVEKLWGIILAVIMFIVALVILNTMLMAVMERYHEIGVMKALGFKNLEVFAMILVEAFYIGVIGSVTGGILGGTLSAIFEKVGFSLETIAGGMMDKIDIPIPWVGKVLYPDFTFTILVSSMIFGILVALIAVLYPAFKSARMRPVEAFHSELKV